MLIKSLKSFPHVSSKYFFKSVPPPAAYRCDSQMRIKWCQNNVGYVIRVQNTVRVRFWDEIDTTATEFNTVVIKYVNFICH